MVVGHNEVVKSETVINYQIFKLKSQLILYGFYNVNSENLVYKTFYKHNTLFSQIKL